MADRMVQARKKSSDKMSEEDNSKLDDLLLEEDDNERKKKENTGVAGKKKSDSKSKSTAAAGGPSKLSTYKSNKRQAKAQEESEMQVEAPMQPGPSTSNHDAVMAALMNIQANQKQQGADIKTLSERMDKMENEYDEYDDYDDNQEVFEGEENENTVEPPPKKQKVDTNNNPTRFSSMAKRRKVLEVCDTKIDDTLAENINDLFRNGMNEDQYVELTKDENNARPENCEGLTVVRTNQLIWNVISPYAQTADKKLQFIERSVVKAATILTKTVNEMANHEQDENQDDNPEMNGYIDNCNDVLALLGHTNRQINLTRREFLKPELMSEYLHLCSPAVPYTSYLFGDDVSQAAKDIENCSKVGNKLRFGRGRGGFRGGRGYRGGRGGYRGNRGARGRGGLPPGYKIPRHSAKNSQRGGNSQQHQKEKN